MFHVRVDVTISTEFHVRCIFQPTKEAIMVINFPQPWKHDVFIEETRAWYQEFWYSDDAANVDWDPYSDEIPF